MLPRITLPPNNAALAGLVALFIVPGLANHDLWKTQDAIGLGIVRRGARLRVPFGHLDRSGEPRPGCSGCAFRLPRMAAAARRALPRRGARGRGGDRSKLAARTCAALAGRLHRMALDRLHA